MDISDLDCPQYVNFMDEGIEDYVTVGSGHPLESENSTNEIVQNLDCRSEDLSTANNSYVAIPGSEIAVEESMQEDNESINHSDSISTTNDSGIAGQSSELSVGESMQEDGDETNRTVENLSQNVSDAVDDRCVPGTSREMFSVVHMEECGESLVSSSSTAFESLNEFPVHKANLTAADMGLGRGNVRATVPKPFNFKTDARLRNKTSEISVDKGAKNRPSRKFRAPKLTQVQPFNLTEPAKRKREDKIPLLAEQIADFLRKTPERFHSTARNDFHPPDHWSPPILMPQSPRLHAVKRQRKINVLSHDEKEQQEAEEVKRYKFHARPLDKKIFRRPHFPKASCREPTKPENIRLRTDRRAEEQNERRHIEEEKFEFHARPVPQSVLTGPVKPEIKRITGTKPKSPALALKVREKKWKLHNKQNESMLKPQLFKALPIPASSMPFTVKHEMKTTEVRPFSFNQKDKERMILKQKKIEEEVQKENQIPVFRAQPMPSPQQSVLPSVPKKPTTQPEPFNLLLENRCARSNSAGTSSELNITFKARPAAVLKKDPFIPEKPPKFVPEIKEFNLHTDRRASERQQLKEAKQFAEYEREQLLLQLKKEEEERERLEVIELRKQIVHKAQPIKHYKSVEIKPSEKPLTQPVSPKFSTDERLQLRR